jgi:hypothetical protein
VTTLATLTIDPRFRGPPESGNGGYVAGLLGAFVTGPAEVRLLKPPPLATALEVAMLDDDAVELRLGPTTLAIARYADVDLEVPPAPTPAAAAEATQRYAGHARHIFPGCFVCGTEREAGDGLRIHAGPLQAGAFDGVAAPWTPDASLAGTRGRVRPEYLWAALDCPGYFAVARDSRVMLLGSLAVRIDRPVAAGEPCVVIGWRIDGEGRRQRAGTALYGADGECVARAVATWVEPRR